jgi:transposase-like protein
MARMSKRTHRGGKRGAKSRTGRAKGGAARRRGGKTGGKRPRYDVGFRQRVAEHSILHGIHAAAKEFGVSPPSVTTWRKAFGINRQTKKAAQAGRKIALAPAAAAGGRERRGYGEDFRREVADYSILNGIQSAARHYKVSMPSVTNWRKAFGITRKSKQNALASVSTGRIAAPPLAKGDRRELQKRFQEFVRAFDRVLAKL